MTDLPGAKLRKGCAIVFGTLLLITALPLVVAAQADRLLNRVVSVRSGPVSSRAQELHASSLVIDCTRTR